MGRTTTYTYDKLNRVIKIEYPDGLVGYEQFWYDDVGSLQYKRDGNGAVTLYEYDALNRLGAWSSSSAIRLSFSQIRAWSLSRRQWIVE